MSILITFVNVLAQVYALLIIAHVLLSYFMSPYHPVLQTVDSLVEPLLAPIRRLLPQAGTLDFSPMILLILVQLIARLLVSLMASF